MEVGPGKVIDLEERRKKKARPRPIASIVSHVLGEGFLHGLFLGMIYGVAMPLVLFVIPLLIDPDVELSSQLGFVTLAGIFTCLAGVFFGAILGVAGGFYLGIMQGLMLALLDGAATCYSLHPQACRALAAIGSVAITSLFIYLLSILLSLPSSNNWLIYLGIPGIIGAIAFVRICWTTIAWSEGERQLTP